MNRFGLAVVVAGVLAVPAFGGSPDPKDLVISPTTLTRARDLVQQLGSDVFREREQAQTELARMGRLARPALLAAVAASPSPEVRARCAWLLPRADAADLRARIDTFLADTKSKFEHDLPAWRLFRQIVGSDAAARALYVEMLKPGPNLELLTALELPPVEAGKAISDRRMSLYMMINPHAFGRVAPGTVIRPRPLSLADVATLVFAETVVDTRHVPQIARLSQVSAATFVHHTASATTVRNTGSEYHAAYCNLIGRWFDSQVNPDELSNYNLINAANNFNTFPETIPLLRRVVTTEGVLGHQKSQALMFLVQRRGRAEQPFLRSLVRTDREADAERTRLAATEPATTALIGAPVAVVARSEAAKRLKLMSITVATVWLGNNGKAQPNQASCQLRDLALAMLLIQHGQDLRSFGFALPPGSPNPTVIGYPNFAFMDDPKKDPDDKKAKSAEARRDAAIAKWRALEARTEKK